MPPMASQYYPLQPGSSFVHLVVFHILENSSCCLQRFLFSVSFTCSQQSAFRSFTVLVTLCQVPPSSSPPSCSMWVNPLSSSQGLFGLPRWLSSKEFTCQCRRHGFNPWVGNIAWRRKRQPTPVFLPGKSHGQRSLAGCSPWHRVQKLDAT